MVGFSLWRKKAPPVVHLKTKMSLLHLFKIFYTIHPSVNDDFFVINIILNLSYLIWIKKEHERERERARERERERERREPFITMPNIYTLLFLVRVYVLSLWIPKSLSQPLLMWYLTNNNFLSCLFYANN